MDVSNTQRRAQLDELLTYMGVRFDDIKLFDQALTHKSYVAEYPVANDNERIEFFGDAVLKFVVSEHLFREFASSAEGELTEILAVLVSAKVLKEVGDSFELHRYIRVGRSVPMRSSIVACAMEAILGALYLDSGWVQSEPFIIKHICHRAGELSCDRVRDNFKAQLQQISQSRKQGVPLYEVVEVTGPPHDPFFRVAVTVGATRLGEGGGRSKKAAEQEAARAAVDNLAQGQGLT